MNSNGMINFYQHKDIQKLLTSYHNPCFDQTQISIPFRMGVIASSGGGKTQFLLNMISKMNDTFGHVYVIYKTSEPLYEFLEKKIGAKYITFYKKLSDLPQPNDIEHKDKQILLVFDDQINEKNQQVIKEYMIRGRKIAKGVSICYLAQSFFRIPIIVRQNFNYLILLKLSSARDLNLIMSDFSLGLDRNQLSLIYKDATKEKFSFLKIDTDNSNDDQKFSKNWVQFYNVSGEGEY